MIDRPKLFHCIIFVAGALSLASSVFINEINLDGPNSKRSKTIEIAAVANTDLAGHRVVVYNSMINRLKEDIPLTGIVRECKDGWGFLSFSITPLSLKQSIAVALVSPDDHIIDFLSFGSSTIPINGVAYGQISFDIANATKSTVSTLTAQRVGFGKDKEDFVWTLSDIPSYGAINTGQTFITVGKVNPEVNVIIPTPFINEFHISSVEGDVDEMVEVAAPELIDLKGYQLLLYDAITGFEYKSSTLDNLFDSKRDGWGFKAISFVDSASTSANLAASYHSNLDSYSTEDEGVLSILNLRFFARKSYSSLKAAYINSQENKEVYNKLKNRQLGLALVDPWENVLEFISYGTSFIAYDGAAKGMTSNFINISETVFAPLETSIQRVGKGDNGSHFLWKNSYETTFGYINSGQEFIQKLPAPTYASGSSGFATLFEVPPFINEIQSKASYDGIRVEVAAQAETDMSGFHLILLDGVTGQVVDTAEMSGTMPWVSNVLGFVVHKLGDAYFHSSEAFAVGLVSKDGNIQIHLEGDRVYRELWGIGANITGSNGPALGVNSIPLNLEGWATSETLSFQRTSSGIFNSGPSWSSPRSPSYGMENDMQLLESVFTSERYSARNEKPSLLQTKMRTWAKLNTPVSATSLFT